MVRLQHAISQPFAASFVAGGLAGAVSRTLVSPLERLKILLQVQGTGRSEYKLSVPSALAKMWREEGLKGFMRGNGSNCIRIVPYSAVQFSSYGFYKRVCSSSLFSHSKVFIPSRRVHFHMLTYVLSGSRNLPRRRSPSSSRPFMRCLRRYNRSLHNLSPRHSPHTALNPISLLRLPLPAPRRRAQTPRHVRHPSNNVQNRRRDAGALQRYNPNSRRRCPLRRSQLHDLRIRTEMAHAARSDESESVAEIVCRCHLGRVRADVHISL